MIYFLTVRTVRKSYFYTVKKKIKIKIITHSHDSVVAVIVIVEQTALSVIYSIKKR